MDAAADSDEHHVRSVEAGVFRTSQDALLPGWHEWESNYQAGEGGGGLACHWLELSDHAVAGDVNGRGALR